MGVIVGAFDASAGYADADVCGGGECFGERFGCEAGRRWQMAVRGEPPGR